LQLLGLEFGSRRCDPAQCPLQHVVFSHCVSPPLLQHPTLVNVSMSALPARANRILCPLALRVR
jgi:hypothetical protein